MNTLTESLSHFLLLFVHPMNAPVNLCANMFLSELAKQRKIEYKAVPIQKVEILDLSWADIVVIGRLCFPEEYDFCKKIKASGRKILYVLDDDLLSIPDSIPSYETFSNKSVRDAVLAFIRLADGLISPSPILLEKYGKGKDNILVEEPAMNFVKPKKIGAVIHIGFAGSADRTFDIENLLSTALKEIYRIYGNRIQFFFMGAIPDFSKEINSIIVPYIDDYQEYRKQIENLNLDIGLAPMPYSDFHACKHYNKFIEYSSLGIAGIYSNVLPYTRLIEKNAPIVLVDNKVESWIKTLVSLIEKPEMLYDLKLKNYEYAREHFFISRIISDIEKQKNRFFSFRIPESDRAVDFGKKRNMSFQRISRALKKYGWYGTFKVVVKRVLKNKPK